MIYYEIEGGDSIFSGAPITIATISKDFINENQLKKIVQYFQYLYTKNVKVKPEGGVVQNEEEPVEGEAPAAPAENTPSGEVEQTPGTPERGPGGQFLPKGEEETQAAPEAGIEEPAPAEEEEENPFK
jgi:hypothetical protein